MMPLCTRPSRAALAPLRLPKPVGTPGPAEKCGCALCTAGAPCVAQRVWAMPVPEAMPSAATPGFQLGHARRAARPAQFAALVHGHAAAVVAAVFQALEAFERMGTMLRG
jgi:hypothetical protein